MPYQIIGEGERLRALRERARLTQEELAVEADLHRNTISNAECGLPVSKPTVRTLADVLIVEPRELARRQRRR